MKQYSGNKEPFVFLACGASDAAAVEETAGLLGTRVFRASAPGRREKRVLAKAAALVLLIGADSLREAEVFAACAAAAGTPVIPVYLEDVEKPAGLRLLLGGTQGLSRTAFDTPEDYGRALRAAPALGSLRVTEAQKKAGRRNLALAAAGLLLAMAAALLLILRPFSVQRIERDSTLGRLGLSGDPKRITSVALYGGELRNKFEEGGVYQAYASVVNCAYGALYLPASDATVKPGTLSDLSDFAQLVNLEELALAGNSVEDISPLLSLKKLKKLDLSMQLRYISDPTRRETDALQLDLSGISALESLETLYLCYNSWPEDGSAPAWMAELDEMPRFRTLVLDREAEVLPALQGKVGYEIVLLGSEVGSFEELKAAAEEPDCHCLYVRAGSELVIPEGEDWTLPENVMLGGVHLTIRVRGTLRVRGWFECGLTYTYNDGAIVVEDGGSFIGGMSDVYNNGSFTVEEGGLHSIERGMEFRQLSGRYLNRGTLVLGWGGQYYLEGGEAVNDGRMIVERVTAPGGMPMPDNWYENKAATAERFTGGGSIEYRDLTE